MLQQNGNTHHIIIKSASTRYEFDKTYYRKLYNQSYIKTLNPITPKKIIYLEV